MAELRRLSSAHAHTQGRFDMERTICHVAFLEFALLVKRIVAVLISLNLDTFSLLSHHTIKISLLQYNTFFMFVLRRSYSYPAFYSS